MKWIKMDDEVKIPIKSWCSDIEKDALHQAINLANHPVIFDHVSLMPDCHVGYGMPIGGVIGCVNAVIPNAVGVDIGCGMGAIQTNFDTKIIKDKRQIREVLNYIKMQIPVGEGNSNKDEINWYGFSEYTKVLGIGNEINDFTDNKIPGWLDNSGWKLAKKNLGTLGGGNHFIEMQRDQDGYLWLMLHSGSRNLGNRIATFYHKKAIILNEKYNSKIPDKNLSYLPFDSQEGTDYIRDMKFAMEYAKENRRLMMGIFKQTIIKYLGNINFENEINIHHNYANLENHFGKNLWIHRKGATSARLGEKGIIPGSMGTSSYIVEGLGNLDSFTSCSHGAGRILGRADANRKLTVSDCDKSMGDIVYDRWHKSKQFGKRRKNMEFDIDLSESPLAYKNIDDVIQSELDLIKPLVKLNPIGVVKG